MIDVNKLRRRCQMPTDNFWGMGTVGMNKAGDRHVFIDRGGSILAVAHLDSVQKSDSFAYTPKKIHSPRLDDRLGAYIILDLLPKMGVVCDVLLTENEEMGMSTAEDFVPSKEYNWIFEFDRGGTDAVMYSYETPECVEMLESVGYVVGYGSYTDICELQRMGVKGFNFPVAYYNYHAVNAYCNRDELETSVLKFLNFYDMYKDIKLTHKEVDRWARYTTGGQFAGKWDYYEESKKWSRTQTYDNGTWAKIPVKDTITEEVYEKWVWKPKAIIQKTTNALVTVPDVCEDCGNVWFDDNCINYHDFDGKTGKVQCSMPFSFKKWEPAETCPYCGSEISDNDILAFDEHGICLACIEYGLLKNRDKGD